MTPYQPLDVVLFFHQLVERFNSMNKCGFCWTFTAPIRESDLNEFQLKPEEKCCLIVAITDYAFDTVRNYNNISKLVEDKYVFHDFRLNILTTDTIGRNVYNEIKNHPLAESKWATILKPIYDCVGSDDIADFCEELGYVVEIQRWSAYTRIDWLENYTGWTINVRLKEQL